VDNLNYFKNNSVPLSRAQSMSPVDLEGKIVTGEFVKREAPEYTELYRSLVERVGGGK
jgi:2-oxoglutarate ferredoxin oxidoreductase subunit beta